MQAHRMEAEHGYPCIDRRCSCAQLSMTRVATASLRSGLSTRVRETIKLMHDDDDDDVPELSKTTLPSHSNLKLIALALTRKSVEVFKDRLIIPRRRRDEMRRLLHQREQREKKRRRETESQKVFFFFFKYSYMLRLRLRP